MTDFVNTCRKVVTGVGRGRSHDELDMGLLRLVCALANEEKRAPFCRACEDSLPEFVDDEISGMDVAREYPDVKHHLDLCSLCASSYVQLLQLAWLIDSGQLTFAGSKPLSERGLASELAEGDSCNG